MKFLVCLLALGFNSAFAQYYNSYTTGNMNNFQYNDYNSGYSANGYSQRIGNTVYSNAYDSSGNSVHCTQMRIGNTITTNCN